MLLFAHSPLHTASISEADILAARENIHRLTTLQGDPLEAENIFLDIIQPLGMLDKLLNENPEDLKEDLEIILRTPSEAFFNRLFNILWNAHTWDKRIFNNASAHWDKRIFNNASAHWLFNLNCMKQLRFITFDEAKKNCPTSHTQFRLRQLFSSEDKHFINLTLLANQKLESTNGLRPLYVAISHFTDYHSETISYALTIILLNSEHFYTHLESYYFSASDAFKQSPKVKSAMQLRYLFRTQEMPPLNDNGITDLTVRHNNQNRLKTNKQTNKERGIFNDDYGVNYNIDYNEDIFSQCLMTYHMDDISAMGMAMNQLDFSGKQALNHEGEALYKRADALYKRIKQLPHEVRTKFFQDKRSVIYSLAHLTLKYERISNPKHRKSTIKTEIKNSARLFRQTCISVATLGAPRGKNIEIPFFRYIIAHLVKYGECSSKNTSEPNAPFIWNAYKDCLSKKESYSPEKRHAVTDWLNIIFHGKKTLNRLISLPTLLFSDIFSDYKSTTLDRPPHSLGTDSDEEEIPVDYSEPEENDDHSIDSEDGTSISQDGITRPLSHNLSAQFRTAEYQKALSQHLNRCSNQYAPIR